MTPSAIQDASRARSEVGATGATLSVREIDPGEASRWLASGSAALVDVREPEEHARERIHKATLIPLSRFDASLVRAAAREAGGRVVLHCRAGTRSAEGCRQAASLASEGVEVYSLSGGIEAWKRAGLPVLEDRRAPRLSVMRQVQLVIGVGVLAGCMLGWMVHPALAGLSAFFGAGLVFAGATGTCALASMLARMPWNRLPTSAAERQDAAGCCGGRCKQ